MRTCFVAAGVFAAACSSGSAHKTVHVAAAADLTHAFGEVGAAFTQKTGIETVIDYGASGVLAKQIEEGARYAVFAAASRDYVEEVIASGKCDRATAALYSHGHIAVWTPGGPVAQLGDLADAKVRRISIADPEHTAYGAAAKQALDRAGLWDTIQSKLVIAENVQAALTYARSGSTDAAIVALSLVIDDRGHYQAVDPKLYTPLEQELVACSGGAIGGDEQDSGKQFAAFVLSADGRAILSRYGFDP